MMKHAYLVMAHHNWNQLWYLLKCIDDKRNDIFLHIDKKSISSFDKDILCGCKYASIVMVDPMSVMWGGVFASKVYVSLVENGVDEW